MRKRGRLKAGRRSLETAITTGAGKLRSPWSLATMAVIVAVVLLALTSPDSRPSVDDIISSDQGTGQVYHDVGIPLTEVDHKASWYTYRSGSNDVRFFTVLGEIGSPHVALDACDVCYSKNLGFHQNTTKMQCNSCGKKFGVEGIGSKNLPNTCWPGFVPYEVSGGFLLIDTEFLDTKAYMFE